MSEPIKDGIVSQPTCADAFRKYLLKISRLKNCPPWYAERFKAMSETPLGSVNMTDLNATHIAACPVVLSCFLHATIRAASCQAAGAVLRVSLTRLPFI